MVKFLKKLPVYMKKKFVLCAILKNLIYLWTLVATEEFANFVLLII